MRHPICLAAWVLGLLAATEFTLPPCHAQEEVTLGEKALKERASWKTSSNPGKLMPTYDMVFASDGKVLASVCARLHFWDAATGKERFSEPKHNGEYITAMAISPDGKLVATAGGKTEDIILWDVAKNEPKIVIKGFRAAVLAFRPDGKAIIAAGGKLRQDGKTVKVIDVGTYEELSSIDLDGRIMGISPDGKTVACWMQWNQELPIKQFDAVQLFDLATGKKGPALRGFSPNEKGGGGRLAFSADGKALAAAGEHRVKVWDTATGKEKFTISGAVGLQEVRALTFSPDGKYLATGGGGSRRPSYLWDAATGKKVAAFRGHVDIVMALAFSPDGATLASAGLDHQIKLWDLPPTISVPPAKP